MHPLRMFLLLLMSLLRFGCTFRLSSRLHRNPFERHHEKLRVLSHSRGSDQTSNCQNLPSLFCDRSTTINFPLSRLYSSIDDEPATNNDQSTASEGNKETFHSSTSIVLEGLNPSQLEAATQPSSAITRVVAGPGSGKTKVLTCRIAHLLDQDRHSRILAVTFTRKAAGEMQQRVESLLRQQENAIGNDYAPKVQNDREGISEEGSEPPPRGLERVTLGTFHSICSKILRYNGNQLATLPSVVQDMADRHDAVVNLDGSFVILDQSDQLRIVKECLDEAELDLKKSGIKPLAVLTAIGQIKESFSQGIDPFRKDDNRKPLPKPVRYAQIIYGSYREKLFSNNAVDFDDLIFMTRELLMQDRELQQRLHKRWPHVLVDEFQDTSRSQMDLVKLLTHSSLFVVGDADQSIYSWRGAHVGSLSDFATEFEEFAPNGVHTVYLKENYRSTSNIVRAAEKVISSSHKSSNEGTKGDARRSMKPKRGSGSSPRVIACQDERAEAKFVVDTIVGMIAEGKLGPDKSVALIYRTNAQSRYLEEACVRKNIPYVIRGGAGGFYKRAEVKDCLCFLRWIHNGNDEGAMVRAIKTPSKGIGDKAMVEFREYCDEVLAYHQEKFPEMKRLTPLEILISMTDAESSSPYLLADGAPEASVFISKRALNNFLPFSRKMRAIYEKAQAIPVDALLFYIIEELDLISHFDSISKSKSEFAERQENVQELRQATKRYSKYGAALKVQEFQGDDELDNESALGIFLDDVALVTDISGDSDNEDNRLTINLMTIHASKGMEFDAVFVVGNEEGTLPSSLALQEGEKSVALEEERRLCYVAMTRAKTELIMTWRKEVTNFSNWSDDGPRTTSRNRSRFLDALVSKKSRSRDPGPTRTKQAKERDTDGVLRQRRSYSGSPASITRRSQPQKSNKSRTQASSARRSNGVRVVPTRRVLSSNQDTNGYGRPSNIKSQIFAEQSRIKNGPAHDSNQSRRPLRSSATTSNRKRIEESRKQSGPAMDSTWFFPVGSDVVHNNFGRGVVLQPPPPGKDKELLVRVQFENGRTMEFPANGSDLSPDLGF